MPVSSVYKRWYFIEFLFLGADLRELKEQISFLSNPTDPVVVGEFLTLRRDVMFLEFDTAIRHCMINTFLSTGNITAMKVILHSHSDIHLLIILNLYNDIEQIPFKLVLTSCYHHAHIINISLSSESTTHIMIVILNIFL